MSLAWLATGDHGCWSLATGKNANQLAGDRRQAREAKAGYWPLATGKNTLGIPRAPR